MSYTMLCIYNLTLCFTSAMISGCCDTSGRQLNVSTDPKAGGMTGGSTNGILWWQDSEAAPLLCGNGVDGKGFEGWTQWYWNRPKRPKNHGDMRVGSWGMMWEEEGWQEGMIARRRVIRLSRSWARPKATERGNRTRVAEWKSVGDPWSSGWIPARGWCGERWGDSGRTAGWKTACRGLFESQERGPSNVEGMKWWYAVVVEIEANHLLPKTTPGGATPARALSHHVYGHMLSHDVLRKQTKSCKRKHETLLFKSYSEKNTFGVIIYIFASSLSILKILKFWQLVIVKGHHIYQF